MSTHIYLKRSRSTGFTLIELMVAMVLGMLTTVIIAQALLNSEGNKRSTTSGGDAQVNGALSLLTVQRDIQMAGYGVAAKASALGCSITAKKGAAPASTAILAPVVISTTGGGGPDQSDTITILSSAKTTFAVPMDLSTIHNASSTTFTVKSALGVDVGDFMLAIPGTPSASKGCTMFQVTAVNALTGVITHSTSSTWNTSLSTIMPTYVSDDDSLVDLGAVRYRTYSIDTTNNVLQVQDLDTSTGAMSTAQTVNPNIVLLKAMYGRDTNGDGVVDRYDDTISTAAAWASVRVIRIAVVARSGQREKTAVTTTSPVWDVGTTATVAPTSNTVSCTPVSAPTRCTLELRVPTTSASATDTTEWQHYRYKVYDTVIPVRNMLWSS